VILVYNLLFKKFSIFTGRDDQSFNFDLFLFSAHGIECYICTGQEHNDDKCIKTVNTCLEDQSVCMTRVEWRFPPYWTPGGVRIHYITKGCDTNADCQRKRNTNKLHCKRDWWNDWTCYDCCNGSKCNYYVTLAASSLKPQLLILLSAAVLSIYQVFSR